MIDKTSLKKIHSSVHDDDLKEELEEMIDNCEHFEDVYYE
jgi:hypothetical protein